jgi:hypothetical protein
MGCVIVFAPKQGFETGFRSAEKRSPSAKCCRAAKHLPHSQKSGISTWIPTALSETLNIIFHFPFQTSIHYTRAAQQTTRQSASAWHHHPPGDTQRRTRHAPRISQLQHGWRARWRQCRQWRGCCSWSHRARRSWPFGTWTARPLASSLRPHPPSWGTQCPPKEPPSGCACPHCMGGNNAALVRGFEDALEEFGEAGG